MIDSIGKITLYVNNQNEARDFWTEKMGFIVRLEQQMVLTRNGLKWDRNTEAGHPLFFMTKKK